MCQVMKLTDMEKCEVGKNKVMSSKLEGKPYRFFLMKEPAFVMKMMTTY